MKLTILSKCFSKMKRVALTLFAALCVGSVWAEEGEVTTPEVTPEPDPAPSTSALSIDPSAGYILTGLGELGDQAAVVFTNSEAQLIGRFLVLLRMLRFSLSAAVAAAAVTISMQAMVNIIRVVPAVAAAL